MNKNDKNAINQIRQTGVADILSFQALNRGAADLVQTQQIGNLDKINVIQQSGQGAGLYNQLYGIQEGNSNEITLNQIGGGNMLIGFQLGFVTSELSRQLGSNYGFGLGANDSYTYGNGYSNNGSLNVGERNKLTINQEGTNNIVMAFQQGSDNTISAKQDGNNNYLILYQKGKSNTITGYNQANTSGNILFDVVVQEGEKLTLNASEASKRPNGNTFIQSGTNLTLQVNNQFANTLGAIGIIQTGKDMKVAVDQSFFPFPIK